jgi:hypothetical protein
MRYFHRMRKQNVAPEIQSEFAVPRGVLIVGFTAPPQKCAGRKREIKNRQLKSAAKTAATFSRFSRLKKMLAAPEFTAPEWSGNGASLSAKEATAKDAKSAKKNGGQFSRLSRFSRLKKSLAAPHFGGAASYG